MKKGIAMLLTVALMTTMLGMTAFAATPVCNYVDVNGDGVCDNRDASCTNYVDANGDGICDHCVNQSGQYNCNRQGKNSVSCNQITQENCSRNERRHENKSHSGRGHR